MSETLDNIFAAYVNQGTLEEAATWMAKLTRNHPELAEDFISALQKGMAAASKGDRSVIQAVNAGGYQVSTTQEAGERCLELLTLYSRLLRQQP
jgi:hypothetical protein